MKNKLILLFILIFLFGGFILFRVFILQKQKESGKMQIISSPASSVFINNTIVGKTPYEGQYKTGEYLVKLIPEGEATQSASWQGKIKVNPNAMTYINRELGSSDIVSAGEILTILKMSKNPEKPETGEVVVDTEPPGAIVYIDNDEKGVSSLILSNITKGDHELSVFMPGFFRRNQKINIDTGYRVEASFKLAIDQAQQKNLEDQTKKESTPSALLTPGKTISPTKAALDNTTSDSKNTVLIKDTPTGWLRVREDATVIASEAARVNPGDKFDLLEEKDGWYKIEYEKNKTGWISSEYAEKQ